jgi:hypothetical protein
VNPENGNTYRGLNMDINTMKRVGNSSLMGWGETWEIRPAIWEGERYHLTYFLFREAVKYAESKGLRDQYLPDLRTENGILHAIHPNGRMIRLKYTTDWDQQEEYKTLVDEMVQRMEIYVAMAKEMAQPAVV